MLLYARLQLVFVDKGYTQMGKVPLLRNKVEPFAALF